MSKETTWKCDCCHEQHGVDFLCRERLLKHNHLLRALLNSSEDRLARSLVEIENLKNCDDLL